MIVTKGVVLNSSYGNVGVCEGTLELLVQPEGLLSGKDDGRHAISGYNSSNCMTTKRT